MLKWMKSWEEELRWYPYAKDDEGGFEELKGMVDALLEKMGKERSELCRSEGGETWTLRSLVVLDQHYYSETRGKSGEKFEIPSRPCGG